MGAIDIPTSVSDFATHMINHVKLQANSVRDTILQGSCENFAEYSKLTGYLQGLDEVAVALTAAIRAAEKGGK